MSKVVKIFLRGGFTPIDPNVLKCGTSLRFDCYIQRFNGFAILIEKGTFLDEKIHKKLTSQRLQIFIKNEALQEYQECKKEGKYDKVYSLEDLDFDEQVENALALGKTLSKIKDTKEQLRAIYFHGKNLLTSWLKDSDKMAPKNALNEVVESLVDVTTQNSVSLYHLQDILESKYSLETHMLNVTFFASLIASKLFLDDEEKKKLLLAGLLHDLGKSEIDESLLDKPEKLSKEEFELMKSHSQNSVSIAKRNGFTNPKLLLGIMEHHERLDGSGYPRGLREHNLSPFGKILAVCDVFDALTTVKPYRGAYTTFNALMLIKQDFKHKLDMKYVLILIKLLK